MTQPTPERLGPVTSLNDERLAELRALAPELFSADDDGINPDALLAFFGLADQPRKRESFGLDWVGKHAAILAAGLPATLTLVPEELTDSKNLILEGDNLEVMRVLRKSYANKIKLIYIDPPYNTGNDFVYPDNFATHENDYLRKIGAINKDGVAQSVNTRSDGRFHAKWLTMMYPRLVLARELLRDDGVIFVSIDDNEVHHLRAIMNEIFGEENFVGTFAWRSRTAKADVPFGVSNDVEWIVSYAKPLFIAGRPGERKYYKSDDYSDRWRLQDLTKNTTRYERPNSFFTLINPKNGEKFESSENRTWSITTETFQDYYQKGKIVFPGDYDFLNIKRPAFRVFEAEDKAKAVQKFGSEEVKMAISTYLPEQIVGRTENGTKDMRELFGGSVFSYPKPVSLIKYLIENVSDSEAIVLDFFAGSGTTAHAVMAQNAADNGTRNFIIVQIPEKLDVSNIQQKSAVDLCESIRRPHNLAEITKERVRRAATKIRNENPLFAGDLGFSSFKLAPSHIVDLPKTIVDDPSQLMNLVFHERLVDKWTPDGLCAELLLREGFALTTPYTTIGDWRCYVHDNGVSLYLNVERKTSAAELVRVLEGRDRDGKRKRNGVAICLDGALTNAELQHLHEHVFLKTV